MIVSELEATPSVGLEAAESGDGPVGEERRISKAFKAVDSISTGVDSAFVVPVSLQAKRQSSGTV
jgi:hypothetical protein